MPEINEMLDAREGVYGSFSGHAEISQRLKAVLAGYGPQAIEDGKYLSSYQREALEMIFHKIARVLNGDPKYIDNWVDIAGYATLVAKELERRAPLSPYDKDSLSQE